MSFRIFRWSGIILIGMTGCYDFSEFDNLKLDPFSPSYAIPVMKSTLTFKDIVEKSGNDGQVSQHPGSNMYYLTYRNTFDLAKASIQFAMVSTGFSDNFQLDPEEIPGTFPVGVNLGPFTKKFNKAYDTFSGSELTRIDLSGGTLQVNLVNNFGHSVSGSIIISSLKNASDDPVVLTFLLPARGSSYNNAINLNGNYFDLLDPPGTYNNFRYSVTATITTGTDPGLTGNIAVQLSLNDPTYQKITGKINQSFVLEKHLYNIGLFASTVLAEQHLADPKFSLSIINSFGTPAMINFTSLEVSNNQGEVAYIMNEGISRPGDLLIGAPNDLKFATTNKTSDTTRLKLNKENSTIEDVFDIAPHVLGLGTTLVIGNATQEHNYFIRNDSKIQLQSEIEIPLSGWVVTHEITDTIQNIEWSDPEADLHLVDDGKTRVRLKLECINELPLNLVLQIKFIDTDGNQVAQLLESGSEWLVKSAPVDATSGESKGETRVFTYVDIDRAKYDNMILSDKMVLVYNFSTGGIPKQNVKILSTDSIGINMSMEATGTVKL
jgi:hypothetical protein